MESIPVLELELPLPIHKVVADIPSICPLRVYYHSIPLLHSIDKGANVFLSVRGFQPPLAIEVPSFEFPNIVPSFFE